MKIFVIVFLGIVFLVMGLIFFLSPSQTFGTNEESQKELTEMKVLYGNCQPTMAEETFFESEFVQAETVEQKEVTKNEFIEEIERCKKSSHLAVCAASGCEWIE